jgi:hypothetical protein
VDCSYPRIAVRDGRKVPTNKPFRGPVVAGPALAGLLSLLREQPAATSTCAHRALASDQVSATGDPDIVLLTYPSGRVWVLDHGWRCDALVGTQATAIRLSNTAEQDIVGLTLLPPSTGASRHPQPDLVGLPLSDAARRNRSLAVYDEVVTRGSAPWRVVYTDPPPGAPRDGEVGAVVSAPRAAACRAGMLRATVVAGEPGAGTAFAALTVVDVGNRPCRLAGPIDIEALSAGGQPIATAKAGVVGSGAAPLILEPSVPGQPQPAVVTAHATLSSTDYAGNCARSHETPAGWRLVLGDGGMVAVRDHNAGSRFPVIVCNAAIYTGAFTLPGLFQP